MLETLPDNRRALVPANKPTHHASIIETLSDWFRRKRHSLNASTADLIEGQDYRLLLTFNGSTEEACISCSCAVRVQLSRLRETFSLSNYYKHLKSKHCTMMKIKKKAVDSIINDESDATDDEETLDSTGSASAPSAPSARSSTSPNVLAASVSAEASTKRSDVVESKTKSKRSRVQ